MKKYFLILFTIFVFSNISLAYAEDNKYDIIGEDIYVIDGDTIILNKEKIRLEGIDCPEMKQLCKNFKGVLYKCGELSKDFLNSLIKNKEIYCKYKGKDIYKRYLGICYVNNNDINSIMVLSGNAISVEYDGVNLYKNEEQIAKEKKAGIWNGEFTMPFQWRMKFRELNKYKF
jgi:endonuclease YncB( thermonuclease family)